MSSLKLLHICGLKGVAGCGSRRVGRLSVKGSVHPEVEGAVLELLSNGP